MLIVPTAIILHWKVSDARERNAAINPSLALAFRDIEQKFFAEEWPNETVRCVGVLKTLLSCSGYESGCTTETYYCAYVKLGFDLPPFYKRGLAFSDESPC